MSDYRHPTISAMSAILDDLPREKSVQVPLPSRERPTTTRARTFGEWEKPIPFLVGGYLVGFGKQPAKLLTRYSQRRQFSLG
jgi:hypothetical protein